MKASLWIHNDESGLPQRDILIGAFLGVADSLVEILTLGKISIDLRYKWAFRCAERECEKCNIEKKEMKNYER